MTIRGGENIHQAEIENFRYEHPAIADARVFSFRDERFGEELQAWPRLKPDAEVTEAEIREFRTGRIFHLKIPLYIRFVDDFPMIATGKIRKFAMPQRMIDVLEPRVDQTD
jgi:fatty-acyl-CoA synthase